MIIKFVPQSLRMSAAGAEGGAGAGGAGAQQQPGTPQTPDASITPANGDNAPVTRAEFQALMTKIDALGQPPKQPDAPKAGDDMTQLLRELSSKVDGLTAQQKAQQLAGRKQQLVSATLDGVPDVNRGLASLALEGLLASTGVNLDAEGVDVNALAKQLGTTLRTQHASLFTAPGSRLTAIPKTADGRFDWSGVRSFSDVPPGMVAAIPDDVIARIVNGSSGESDASLPRNIFYRH